MGCRGLLISAQGRSRSDRARWDGNGTISSENGGNGLGFWRLAASHLWFSLGSFVPPTPPPSKFSGQVSNFVADWLDPAPVPKTEASPVHHQGNRPRSPSCGPCLRCVSKLAPRKKKGGGRTPACCRTDRDRVLTDEKHEIVIRLFLDRDPCFPLHAHELQQLH